MPNTLCSTVLLKNFDGSLLSLLLLHLLIVQILISTQSKGANSMEYHLKLLVKMLWDCSSLRTGTLPHSKSKPSSLSGSGIGEQPFGQALNILAAVTGSQIKTYQLLKKNHTQGAILRKLRLTEEREIYIPVYSYTGVRPLTD